MEIDVFALPSLPIPEYQQFPQVSVIYFVITESGAIEYIGKAGNLRKRWYAGHHCIYELNNFKACRVAWFEVAEKDDCAIFEKQCIETFCPRLNFKFNSNNKEARNGTKQRTRKSFVDDPDWILTSEAAKLRGVSREAIQKMIIRGRIKSLYIKHTRFVSRKEILSLKIRKPRTKSKVSYIYS